MKGLPSLLLIWLSGCTGIPKGVDAVEHFDAQRYLGTWYEVARLDYRFERGLSDVTATYSQMLDGTIRVVNRGYNPKTERWETIQGRAKLVAGADVGRLKVSFFWPFYAGYNVIALDEAYSLALGCGYNRSYLWILARTPDPPKDATKALVEKARTLGFDTDALLFVSHTRAADGADRPDPARDDRR
jgi:apolipoprotein D and lipocalin family protein